MTLKREQSNEGEKSISLQIIPQPSVDSNKFNDHRGSFFEPQREPSDRTPTGERNTSSHSSYLEHAPEKKLTLFALRLAILEKGATGLGTLGFIWATVVLLGGFAVTLKNEDFWIVSAILVVESSRIFSRSHELEWQHQSTWSVADAGKNSFRAIVSSSRFLIQVIKAIFKPFSGMTLESRQCRRIADDIRKVNIESVLPPTMRRTWHFPDVPLFPYPGWVFLSRNISRALSCFQIISAFACMALSLMRLIQQDYGVVHEGEGNRKPALNVFYGLAVAEALMLLLEKAYWEWKISICKLIVKVNKECDFGIAGTIAIKRFFYDAYSSCISGSIFDGLRMDLISFAEELLDSDSRDEQLIGVRILHKFATTDKFSSHTLQKIGISTSAIERLVEMVSWKKPAEEEIRQRAAEIVSKLAGRKQNALRVAGIPGSIECISSLLYTGRVSDSKPYDIWERNIVADQTNYEFSAFNLLGLLILKKLANDHDNCFKIGNTRGLLSQIIDFTCTGERLLRNDLVTESQIKIARRSLQLVKKLVSTTGHTGKSLRQEISENVFTVSNIRETLEYGENHMVLQKLGIGILTSLAMDENAREKIGCTGGVIKLLLSIFWKPSFTEDQDLVSIEAGEALAMLALDSTRNCNRILKQGRVVERLVDSLNDKALRINSARILRNLCAYSGDGNFLQLRGVIAATPIVLKSIMEREGKPLEVSTGLATQVFRFMSPDEFRMELRRSGITEINFAKKLVQILEKYNSPNIKVPRIRRFVVQMSIWMMQSNEKYIQLFKISGMDEQLECITETTSELECYNIFSGSVGLGRQNTSLTSLVDSALELLVEC